MSPASFELFPSVQLTSRRSWTGTGNGLATMPTEGNAAWMVGLLLPASTPAGRHPGSERAALSEEHQCPCAAATRAGLGMARTSSGCDGPLGVRLAVESWRYARPSPNCQLAFGLPKLRRGRRPPLGRARRLPPGDFRPRHRRSRGQRPPVTLASSPSSSPIAASTSRAESAPPSFPSSSPSPRPASWRPPLNCCRTRW